MTIAYRDAATGNRAGLTTTTVATIPATVQPGDLILAFFYAGSGNMTQAISGGGAGSSWSSVYAADATNLAAYCWQKTAVAADAGATATVTTTLGSTNVQRILNIVVWSGAQVGANAYSFASAAGTARTCPAVTASSANAWLVNTCVDRGSPGSTNFTLPGGLTAREAVYLTGGGAVSAVVAGSNGAVGSGSVGANTITGTFSTSTALTSTVVLEPVSVATPTANAGADKTTTVGTGVNLSGSASGGTPGYTYSWALTSALGGAAATLTNGTTATPTVTPTAPGVLTYTLTVTDSGAQVGTSSCKVYVTSSSVRPIAITSNSGGWAAVGAVADSAAAMADNDPTTYAQSPDSPSSPSTLRVRLAPLAAGTGFNLAVDNQLSASVTGTATVSLYEGSNLRKTWTITPSTSLATTNLTLTTGELATIVSFNALDVEFAWNV